MKSLANVNRSLFEKLPVLAALAALLLVAAPSAALASDDSSDDMVVFGGQHQVIKAGQEVGGDLVVIGGSADVLGKVDGDAVAIGGKIYIAPQGHVNGSLVNLGGIIDNESNTPQGHGIQPPVFPTPEPPIIMPVVPEEHTSWFQGWPTFFFIDALLAFMAFLLFPARTRAVTEHLLDNPVLAGMLGFFSPIILALVLTALAVTVIGIPLIPLAVLVTIAGYLIGKAAIAEFLGSRFVHMAKGTPPAPAMTVLVGLLIFFVICAFTGWIGVVIYFTVAALALGAAIYMLMRTAQAYRRLHPATTPAAPTFAPPVDPTRTGPPAAQ